VNRQLRYFAVFRLLQIRPAADDVELQFLEVGQHRQRQVAIPRVVLRLKDVLGRQLLEGPFRLADEFLQAANAELIVSAPLPGVSFAARLDAHLARVRGQPGLVAHIPAERDEERVQELVAQVRLVVTGLLVLDQVLVESLDEPTEFLLKRRERDRVPHARAV